METKKMTTASLKKMKQAGEPIAMVTAYDFPSATLAVQAGADMLLVGDSLGMVVLGYGSTVPVTIEDMIHHSKATVRGAGGAFVVTDMPFATYHGSVDTTLRNAARLMQEGAATALKLEGGEEIAQNVEACVHAGIPVMGHLGLTPQAIHRLGGYKVQGKDEKQARKLLDDALRLQEAGCFAIVLEMVPESLAAYVTEKLEIPTIGIGAGRNCDGQVLVYHDLLGYASPLAPRFVKRYASVGDTMQTAISDYVREVKSRSFPQEQHTFSMPEETMNAVRGHKGAVQR